MNYLKCITLVLACSLCVGCASDSDSDSQNTSTSLVESVEYSEESFAESSNVSEESDTESIESSTTEEIVEKPDLIVTPHKVVSESVYLPSDTILMQARAMRINIGDIVEFPMTSCPTGRLVFENNSDCVKLSIGADGRTHISALAAGFAKVTVNTENGMMETVSVEVLK